MAKVGVKGRPGQKSLNFTTHGLLPASATQEDVFKAGGEDMVQVSWHSHHAVCPGPSRCGSLSVTQLLLEGYNATVFAYGQTGAGKTYTMVRRGDNSTPVNRPLHPPMALHRLEDKERGSQIVGLCPE